MNTINIIIDFENGINRVAGIDLITGDYASTKIHFTFDKENGTKVFEMKNPSGTIVYAGEITNNEVVLAGESDASVASIFNEPGEYIYEVSLYDGDTKLTSCMGKLPVKQEQVVIGDEVIEAYLPIFDELMQEISTAITETNNLNIDAEKVDTTTTITITKKDGTSYDVEILDGEKGDKGDKGDAGAIKMLIVASLPQTGADDTIYLVPYDILEVATLPTTGLPKTIYIITSTQKRYIYASGQWAEISSDNRYTEYVYVNNAWEELGEVGIQVDLSNYYTKQETNTLLNGKANTSDIPTTTSQLTNNSGFITNAVNNLANYYTKTEIDNTIGNINSAIDSINGEVI